MDKSCIQRTNSVFVGRLWNFIRHFCSFNRQFCTFMAKMQENGSTHKKTSPPCGEPDFFITFIFYLLTLNSKESPRGGTLLILVHAVTGMTAKQYRNNCHV